MSLFRRTFPHVVAGAELTGIHIGGRSRVMMSGSLPLVLAAALLLLSCSSPDRDTQPDSARAPTAQVAAEPTDPDSAGASRSRIGVLFDPGTIRVGDTVAGLTVTEADVQRAAADSSYVGRVGFRGTLGLTGRTLAHFDNADVRCFETDATSAARLPRWSGDRRRAWFCFSNVAAAEKAFRELGPAAVDQAITIEIDRLTIHRGLSDQVNEARFVRVYANPSTPRS